MHIGYSTFSINNILGYGYMGANNKNKQKKHPNLKRIQHSWIFYVAPQS